MITLPGDNGSIANIGVPQLPVKTVYIEVTTDEPVVTLTSSDYVTFQNYNLCPVQDLDNDSTPAAWKVPVRVAVFPAWRE